MMRTPAKRKETWVDMSLGSNFWLDLASALLRSPKGRWRQVLGLLVVALFSLNAAPAQPVVVATPPAHSRRVRRVAGSLFMIMGVALLLLSSAFLGYVQYTDWQLSHVVTLVEAAPIAEPSISPALETPHQPEEEASVVAPEPPLVPAHRILIPSIDLDARVVELGTREEKGQLVWDTAAHAVGWYYTTALPGQGSNIVMSGHISSPLRGEGSIFRHLPNVKIGDVVLLETSAGQHRYEVFAREIVPPTAIGVMAPTPTETLTLITCYPDLVYSHRLVLQAVPVEG